MPEVNGELLQFKMQINNFFFRHNRRVKVRVSLYIVLLSHYSFISYSHFT